jgi:pimeloyl-ACP methyl ester carboxylesterase
LARLADRFRLIAPDLRGFGDSDKPTGPFGPHDHASDLLELVNKLAIEGLEWLVMMSGAQQCCR